MIVGDGPSLAALRALAATLSIEAATWFAGSRADVPELLRAFDVFVLPSLERGHLEHDPRGDGDGLAGRCHRGGRQRLNWSTTRPVCLFTAGDDAALARALGRYLADTSCARCMVATRAPLRRNAFSLPAMVAGYQGVYDALAR